MTTARLDTPEDTHDPFAAGELTASLIPTAPQHELWIASQVGGADANRSFNECLTLTLRGPLNVEVLRLSIQALMDRHESLRCSFTPDGQRFTVISSHQYQMRQRDLAPLTESERASALADLRRAEVETPFALEQAPLFRATLVRLHPDVHQLIFSAHHVVCDGWSAGVLMHELAALYRAGAKSWPLPPTSEGAGLEPAASFAKYAAAARARAKTPEGVRDEAFWTERLAGELKQIELPTDHQRPSRRTYASNRLDLELDPKLLAGLRALGAKSGCTFLVTLMGAFQAWLSRLTGQRDLIIGMPAAGQAVAESQSLVGHCVHVLPIRMTVDPAKSVPGHLAALKPVMLDALDARQVTFSSLLRKLNLAFDPTRIPLIPVCINVDNGLGKLDFGNLDVAYDTIPRAFESFELFVNAVDHRDRLVVEWSYNTALFDEATIRRWMGEVTALVRDAIAHPERPVKDLAILPPSEIDVLRRLNATDRPIPGVAVHDQVARRAQERPDHPAVVFHDKKTSYAALDRRANQLARLLRQQGVKPGDCVGVYLERSERLPMALLAVLRCGAAYVPMDPSYPAERLTMMAEDGGVTVVVTESALLPSMPKVDKAVALDQIAGQLEVESTEPLGIAVQRDDRAYVLFTSGSTGRPKGVEIPHVALENFLASMQREPGFTPADRLLAVTTISFDIAGLEMFLPLVTGGTIVLADRAQAADPDEIAKLLAQHDINVMQATPATWRMLIDSGWKGNPSLRVLCGGEALTPGLAEELGSRVGEVWNMYGPTETTVWSTLKRMARGGRVTIGKPIDNTKVYILDENRASVPLGASGEIWISGDGVALGYRGRPDLTQERFVDDPFLPGARMYRTGDLGRVLASGELDCLGRSDSQVKIRGFRIELAEIEKAMESCPGVRKAVVLLIDRGQSPQLAGYWASDPTNRVEAAALKEHLKKLLPPYMLPQHFVAMESWPLTPAGKIDRKALPVPKAERASGGGEPFRDDVDLTIAEIWQELLGVEEVGLADDFFSLGGQSLLAVRFVATVKARLGVPFNLATLFGAPTLREVADAIRGGGGQLERGAVVLRREPGAPRVFFICGVHIYRAAAMSLGKGFESYGVIVSADEQLEVALRTGSAPRIEVPALLAEYIAAIRAVQPHGPYNLAGVSFGGVLAYEIARQLQVAGEQVSFVGLFDPILPSAVQRDRLLQFQQMMHPGAIWNLGAKVAKKLRRDPRAPAGQETDADAANRLADLRNEAYDKAISEWEKDAQPYQGDAVLFYATDKREFQGTVFAPDLGWSRLVRGKLEIQNVDGNHLSILEPPLVDRIGEVMRRRLTVNPKESR